MLHHRHENLTPPAAMAILRRLVAVVLLGAAVVATTSCAPLTRALDGSTGFSRHLGQVEAAIRGENWPEARIGLEDSRIAWKKLKPVIQLDIDHDYIKNIEDDLVRLSAYLDTEDKSNSLATVLLIRNTWQDIDAL